MSIELEMELDEKPAASGVKVPPSEPAKKDFVSPRVRNLLIGGGAVLLAVVMGLYFYYGARETTDDAQVDGDISPVASKIFGRVQSVLVKESQTVKAGQVLVQIDPRDAQAAVDLARGAVALAESEARSAGVDVPWTEENVASGSTGAQAQLAEAQANSVRAQSVYDQARTADLAYAQANVDKSRANAELAAADLARFTPLAEKGEISKQQLDAARANASAAQSTLQADQERYIEAQRNVETANAALAAARARVEQALAGVSSAHSDYRKVGIRQADAQAKLAKVTEARAQLETAQLQLNDATIAAPVDGVVTAKQVEPGQIVQPGQGLLVVVPLQGVWVTANFKETQLRHMKPGQKAYISVDTYGKTVTGHVESIAGATGAKLSLLPPENATGNYVKVVQRIPVRIALDAVPADQTILRPGMNADVTVVTK